MAGSDPLLCTSLFCKRYGKRRSLRCRWRGHGGARHEVWKAMAEHRRHVVREIWFGNE